MQAEISSLGRLVALWRYPVKSMGGEQIASAPITERGILGDRSYAVLDRATGYIASAKHPAKWHKLLQCRAAFAEPPQPGRPLPPIWITLPDGALLSSQAADVDRRLSHALGRDVRLICEAPAMLTREADRTPIDSAGPQKVIRQEQMALAAPAGTFFDYAALHVLTTAALEQLQSAYPASRFDARRFRPNLVVAPNNAEAGFVENSWLGMELAIGASARLFTIDPCPRCVLTTLAQGGLPDDAGILRAVAQQNSAASVTMAPGVVLPAVAGIYANVVQSGAIACGDSIGRASRHSTTES